MSIDDKMLDELENAIGSMPPEQFISTRYGIIYSETLKELIRAARKLKKLEAALRNIASYSLYSNEAAKKQRGAVWNYNHVVKLARNALQYTPDEKGRLD